MFESIVCTCRCLSPGGGVKPPVAMSSAAAEVMDMFEQGRGETGPPVVAVARL